MIGHVVLIGDSLLAHSLARLTTAAANAPIMIADSTPQPDNTTYTGATIVIAETYSTFSNCDSTDWYHIAKALAQEPPPEPPPVIIARHFARQAVPKPPLYVQPHVSRPIQQCCWRSGRWKSLTGRQWRS